MKKMQAPDIEIIVRNVDRLVRNRQNMNRFREMVRRWYNAHTDKPEYELLPLSSRKHTLTEMYTLLAVIHDRYCGGMEEINPWTKVPKLSVVGTAYFDLFSYVDTQLYDNDNCTLENYLHHVKADLDAKVTIANEGQTTDTDSNISVRIKTTVGKGSKQIKAEARLSETAETEQDDEPDGDEKTTGNISGMPWKEAKKKAEALVDEKGYLGHKKLYEAIGCSGNTLRKAIENSSKLQEAKKQYQSTSNTLKAVGFTAKVIATYETSSGPKLSYTEADEILVEMLERIKRERPEMFESTKTTLDKMDSDGKRRFAAVYKQDYQNKKNAFKKDGPKTQRQYKQV